MRPLKNRTERKTVVSMAVEGGSISSLLHINPGQTLKAGMIESHPQNCMVSFSETLGVES